jgi:aquaporin Z
VKSHFPEYLSEFFGTAIMMAIGVGAITLMWADGTVMQHLFSNDPLRRLITGLIFAGGATLVVISPLGQRSGGHLNPAVTLAFWWKKRISNSDAAAYVLAQLLGALFGVFFAASIGGAAVQSVHLGLTAPGTGYGALAAFLAEIGITAALVLLILFCVDNPRIAPRTPYFAGLLVAFLVFVEAPISGTSLNPARSFAPALLTGTLQDQWLYLIGPLIGSLMAVTLAGFLFKSKRAGCAKLFHTEKYRCIFLDCVYRVIPAGSVLARAGEVAETAFLVERGTLEARIAGPDGVELVLGTIGPGEWVGEMALLLDQPRSATVVALTDVELQVVTKDNLAHIIAEHPSGTERLLKLMAGRLAEANARLGQAGSAGTSEDGTGPSGDEAFAPT